MDYTIMTLLRAVVLKDVATISNVQVFLVACPGGCQCFNKLKEPLCLEQTERCKNVYNQLCVV